MKMKKDSGSGCQSKVYPDTSQGAISMLIKESSINMTDSTARPDPFVCGVWEVKHPNDDEGHRSIVYLAGYKDPRGKIREHNDWETESKVEQLVSELGLF